MSEYVLVVDDEPELTQLLEVTLNNISLRTVAVHDGDDALAQVQKEKPSLILLDLMMPRVSGFKVLERLRADARTSEIPVIVISAYASPQEAQDLRAHQVMAKGKFGAPEIRQAVRMALGMV